MALTSPGVSVTVIDQSNYAPTGPGTIPFILIATKTDKTSSTGSGIAAYTTTSTVNTLQLVSSQKELLTNYGVPIFPTDASGNRLFGSETAEYGLMAAHSTLAVTNQAYILRANIDLSQLTGSSSRPYANPDGGTQWMDTATTSYGVFEWDYTNEVFTQINPTVITSSTQLTGGIPYSNVGVVGSYAINATDVKNPIYRKAYDNSWNLIGSNAWTIKTPTIIGNAQASALTLATALVINGNTFTIANTSASNLAATINSAGLSGINAQVINGYFNLFANSSAKSGGYSASSDGKITISNSSGNPLNALGLTPGTYYSPALQYGAHYSVPAWKSTDAQPHPTGSIWMKTTAVNGGANFKVYRYNSSTKAFDTIPAPVYSSRRTALYGLDKTLGGLGIAKDTLFVAYDVLSTNTGTYKLLQWNGGGLALDVTGSVSNPTFTAGNSFTIRTTSPGTASYSSYYTITLSGTSAASFVSDLLAANVPYLSATLNATNNIVISHTTAGSIEFHNVSGTPITDAGITTSLDNVFDDSNSGYLVGSYWYPASNLYQQSTQPINEPVTGTYWYASTPLEVDIMINNGTNWRGYKNISSDARGYNLANTDPLGPQISATAPTTQSDNTSLVYGDLWIDSSDLENYPKIYRWQSVNGTDQWVQINNTDNTTENGILFADARWDTNGTVNPALDPKPTIVSLLTSNYLDLDAPNPQLYPRGMLLFNTRRSTYNVKSYESNAWNSNDYPLQTLPSVSATWNTVSGSDSSGMPYMGRKAVRNVVVSAFKNAVDNNTTLREDQTNFNLLVCPGYPELTTNLISLNNDRRNTGFIIADTPMGLTGDTTSVSNYVTNVSGVATTSEDGLATSDPYTAVFYPGAGYTNALDGNGQVVVPITHAILRMIIKSDQASAPWFAPAGSLRGKIDNLTKIGYVDRVTGKFYSIGTNQGLRDLLYSNNVNPVAVFPTEGILNYGNHTRQATATALDRINVARLINYLRYNLERIAKPLVFEPNDTITRNTATNAVSALLNDVKTQRGVYDYLVVCDTTNNTPSTIDKNELHIDVAIEPTKAVEFIYIPVRILNTGAIAGTGANQGGLSNITPSVTLGT
jgi:Phage tail sheath C-terminal domain